MKKLLYIATILFSLQFAAVAQEADTFIHTIKQGETVYSIARTYKITQEDIIRLNPSAANGIKAGATLIIPQKDTKGQQDRFHTIQAGETLYKLTKTYQVSAEKICKANPGLTAENFKAGMVIRIPPADEKPVQQESAQEAEQPKSIADSGCKEMYKVKRKETLYSIARKYGLTEDEIRKANPDMLQPDYKLKKGEYICIPFPQSRKATATTVVVENIPTNEELIGEGKTPSAQKLIRMGVILPFKGGTAENDKMVEFYRGVLMAVEEIKKSGTSVEIYAYDSGKSAGDLQSVTANPPLSQADFIIGPLYPEQTAPLSKFCQQRHIKLVVPFSSQGECVYQNPYYYAVNPPKSFMQSEACQLTMKLFGKENIIILDSKENDKDACNFTDMVKKKYLQQENREAKVLEINDNDLKWLETVTQYKTNVIIPNSSSIKLLNQLFPKLQEFAKQNPEYAIKLVGYPEWQTYTSNHLENFYQFDTYVYSSFYRNPLNGRSDQFENAYQKTFYEPTLTSWPRFGMLGYDIAYYFLKGISSYGPAFEQYQSQIVTKPYQSQFRFGRISNWSGFINREMEFIHYTPSHSIELIRLKP